MGSGKSLLVLKKYNIADILDRAFDSRLRKKVNKAKNVIFAKISVFWSAKDQFWFFGKKIAGSCLFTSYYITKSGSPQDLRYDPSFQHLYTKEWENDKNNILFAFS